MGRVTLNERRLDQAIDGIRRNRARLVAELHRLDARIAELQGRRGHGKAAPQEPAVETTARRREHVRRRGRGRTGKDASPPAHAVAEAGEVLPDAEPETRKPESSSQSAPSLTDPDDGHDRAADMLAPKPRVSRKVRLNAEEQRLLRAYQEREARLERERAEQAAAAATPAPDRFEAKPRERRFSGGDCGPINPMRMTANDGPPPAGFDPEKPMFEEAPLKSDWRVTPAKRTTPALRKKESEGAKERVAC